MRRRVTAYYAAIQGVFWITYGLMFCFASLFLLDCGYTNSAIGVLLGICYALSALLQPVLASIFARSNLRLNVVMAVCYVIIAALAVCIRAAARHSLLLSALMVCELTLQSALEPSVNSLHREFELAGEPVNFGLARGVGSTTYSLACLLVGQLMRFASPKLVPIFYLSSSVLLAVLLIFFRAPKHKISPAESGEKKHISIWKQSPMFMLFCAGLVGISISHMFVNSFYLQIFQSLGGGSGEHGIAVAIAAIVELPMMALYMRLSRRAGCHRLILIAGWVWVLKTLITFIASRAGVVYIAALLQFAGYAIYVPAGVQLAGRLLGDNFLQGQAMIGSAYTLGSLISTLAGGPLIDLIGVHGALGVMMLPVIIGAALWTIAMLRIGRETA